MPVAMPEEFYRIKRLPPYVFAEVNALKAAARAEGRDVIDLGMGNPTDPTPEIVVNCRSSGLATADAIVPGSPPGNPALTFSVGKSTFGRSLTGSARYAMTPNTAMPSMMRLVAIGRRMKTVDTFTGVYPID